MNDELNFKRIPANVAKSMIEEGATLADIRDPDSFNAAHVNGAQHLTNTNIEDFVRDNDLDKPLVVYCYHGNSSQPASAYLYERGFEDVYSMDGGFEEWHRNYPDTVVSNTESE